MAVNLYVANLPFTTTDDQLREAFAVFGTVVKAQVMLDRGTGRSRGFGFVEMSTGHLAAIDALNGAEFEGRRLTVNEAKPEQERPRRGGFDRRKYGHDGSRRGRP